jgi:hypothetical protein
MKDQSCKPQPLRVKGCQNEWKWWKSICGDAIAVNLQGKREMTGCVHGLRNLHREAEGKRGRVRGEKT